MSFSNNEMDEIINDFITEASEGLDALDQKFIELEKKPGDTTLLNDIFRSIHTIEDVLNKLRKGDMAVTAPIMDAILQAVDIIKLLLNNIRERSDKEENVSSIINILKGISSGRSGASAAGAQPPQAGAQKPRQAEPVKAVEPVKAPESVKAAEPVKTAEPAAKAEPPVAPAPGPQASATVKDINPAASRSVDKEPSRPQAKADEGGDKTREREQSIRVDIGRLDAALNLAGELVLSRNRLTRLGSKLNEWNAESEIVAQMEEAISQLGIVTSDIQLAVMKMRMQPIAKVFNKFPRMVRDLARTTNKEVELVLSGEETELDKTVIEEIGDPLVHIVRNSIDHGIETPEERVAMGKPRCGTINLSAYQEGRNIIVAISDDGKGINPDALKKSAFEKGLITAEDAEKLPAKDALSLIFIPGFSTAAQVSSISGRGVGMDVVKTNISRINGTISIDSEVGKGTRILFRLPLTLAIIQALTVEANGEVLGIPLSNVIENIRVTSSEIKTIEGREVIRIRDTVYPLVRLGSIVSGGSEAAGSEWKYIVIISIGERKIGLIVDRLHGQEEIVMKSMGEYLKGTEGISGACINGDGKVILILDIAGLVESVGRVYAK
ncbi:MAG: chemotaxis protein CheA [Deltaproteobacteria bacterium]|nr:chemotaxis protein CheA [Deltaproteobacteria bacterium]